MPGKQPLGSGKCIWILPALALAVMVAGSGCRPAEQDTNILARVGETVITATDLQNELARYEESGRPVASPEELLEELILRRQTLLRARQAGLDEDPSIRRELENLLIAKLRDAELAKKLEAAEITEEELEAEYQRRVPSFTRPAKSRLAILYLETPALMSEGRRTELEQRMAEARNRAWEQPGPKGRGPAAQGFGALAIEYSDHQASRYRGGDIGWLDHGSFEYRWPREVLKTGYALKPGEISEWIETDEGFYLVTRTDFRDASTPSLDQVKSRLQSDLLAQKRKALQEEFVAATAGMFPAEVHTNNLAALDLSTDAPAELTKNRESVPPPTTPSIHHSTHAN